MSDAAAQRTEADGVSRRGAGVRWSGSEGVALIALSYTLLHAVTASRYGYFRDALYYVAYSRRLGWGYVDHPPLIVFVTWAVRHVLGSSLPALLLVPILAGARAGCADSRLGTRAGSRAARDDAGRGAGLRYPASCGWWITSSR
jgi:hypothetical protein